MDFDHPKSRELLSSGRWWDDRWWEAATYRNEFNLREHEVAAAFSALRGVFHERWATDNLIGQHPLMQELFGASGLAPFSVLFALGRGILVLRQADLLGNLPRRLRDKAEFEGACGEMEVLAPWVEAGLEVRRDVPSGNGGRNCDWMVSDGKETLYGEVKSVYASSRNSARSDAGEFILGVVLERLGAAGIFGDFELELLARPKSLIEAWGLKETARGVSRRVLEDITSSDGGCDGEWRVVDGVVRFRYRAGIDLEGLHGSFSGIPYDMEEEGEKIMAVVLEAAQQLPSHGQGLVVLVGRSGSSTLPFSERTGARIRERFIAVGARCPHVCGVLFVRKFLVPGHGLAHTAVLVRSPVAAEPSLRLLRKGFPQVEIWPETGAEA